MHQEHLAPFNAKNVSKSFQGRRVLHDLSWRVEQGSIVGLLGANGAGKTTLLKILLGLLPPDSGVAEIHGADAANLPPEIRERVGYVPQSSQLFAWLTGKAMLRYVGSFYPRFDDQYAQVLAERLQVSLKTPIEVLSPGQQQRLSIVRALSTRPDALVLDEPMAALDPAARLCVIEELLREKHARGLTIVVSSHIVHDLERYCTHLAVVEGGTIAEFQRVEFFLRLVRFVARGEEALLKSHTFAGAFRIRNSAAGERTLVVERDALAALRQGLPAGISVEETGGDLESVLSEWMR
jgi:ABC-2 type transport system ATP-binding protein